MWYCPSCLETATSSIQVWCLLVVGMSLVCFNDLNFKTTTTGFKRMQKIQIFFGYLTSFILHFSSRLHQTFLVSSSSGFLLTNAKIRRCVLADFDLFVVCALHTNMNLNCAFWVYAGDLHIRRSTHTHFLSVSSYMTRGQPLKIKYFSY